MGNWRDTYRPARFFFLDARILFLVLPTMLHARWYTATACAVAAAALYYCERISMDTPSALRLLRSTLAGRVRPGRPLPKIRREVDFDRRDQ